ncbi:MAG TPA: hypothetical protein VGK24_10645 [Candidatus Angelobacter sp.]|jgi:hypothetical protein
MGRSSSTKAEWLGALETAAKLGREQPSAIWLWIMQELGLGPQYFLAIREAVQQGRWRTAKNPRAYLKTVAKREALKMGLLTERSDDFVLIGRTRIDDEEISSEENLDYLGHQYDSSEAIQGADGVWRTGKGGERDYDDPRQGYDSYRDWLVSHVPGELAVVQQPSKEWKAVVSKINESTDEFHLHARPSIKPNWNKWAQEAGMDEWEKRVLGYRLSGTSRERAIGEQPDEESRKALQAAWKRFERNGMERLREAAKIKFEKNVPE